MSDYNDKELKELQNVLLEMLQVLDETCHKIGIPYYIEGGTCLGAIRHGGFIPWDDDADIAILSKDYDRFLAEAPAALPKGYTLHTYLGTPGNANLWVCLWKDGTKYIENCCIQGGFERGIYIDILPICPIEKNSKAAQKQWRHLWFWQHISYAREIKHPDDLSKLQTFLTGIIHPIARVLFSREKIYNSYRRAMIPKDPSDIYTDPASYEFVKFNEKDLLPAKRIKFEDIELDTFNNPEKYCEVQYGDWQKLPPVEERHVHRPQVLEF